MKTLGAPHVYTPYPTPESVPENASKLPYPVQLLALYHY